MPNLLHFSNVRNDVPDQLRFPVLEQVFDNGRGDLTMEFIFRKQCLHKYGKVNKLFCSQFFVNPWSYKTRPFFPHSFTSFLYTIFTFTFGFAYITISGSFLFKQFPPLKKVTFGFTKHFDI